jgi:hypothetical protein
MEIARQFSSAFERTCFDQALASRTPSRPAANPVTAKAEHMTATAPSRSRRQKHLNNEKLHEKNILVPAGLLDP